MVHNRWRSAWPLLCLALLFYLLNGWASAQQSQTQAPVQINPDVLVNGKILERSAIIGSTGKDLAVKATPLLRATGASVEFDGNKLEASWSESMLTLTVGRSYCIYNGQNIKLEAPAGLYENDLVVQLNDLCSVIKASVTQNGQQIAVQSANLNSATADPNSQLATAPLPALNGHVSAKSAYLANIQSGGSVFGMPALGTLPNSTGNYSSQVSLPDSMENPSFPEAGMGGLTTKNAKSSPYERPVVSVNNVGSRQITTETPRNINDLSSMANSPGVRYPSGLSQMSVMSAGVGAADFNLNHPSNQQQQPAIISYSSVPGGRTAYNYPTTANPKEKQPEPAKPEVVEFDVLRQMSFYATAYEIKATIRNTGELAVQKPFMVKFMVKSHKKKNAQWDVVESYLINPLEPGQQVEISKRVDGHQYSCLMDLSIDFKASVIEEVIIPTTGLNGRNWTRAKKKNSNSKDNTPTYSQTMTRAKETSFKEKNLHF